MDDIERLILHIEELILDIEQERRCPDIMEIERKRLIKVADEILGNGTLLEFKRVPRLP